MPCQRMFFNCAGASKETTRERKARKRVSVHSYLKKSEASSICQMMSLDVPEAPGVTIDPTCSLDPVKRKKKHEKATITSGNQIYG